MSEYERRCNDCKIGVKAYQNIVGSLNAFDRLIPLMESGDHFILSSLFCFAVVKYAKPFIETKTPFGKARYPVKSLSAAPGFALDIHKHILELRNTLVAHDDMESIDPRILHFCISPHGENFSIPISMVVSNKCLSYPVDIQSIGNIRGHVEACAVAVSDKLNQDMAKVREFALNHPEEVTKSAKYHKDYGQASTEPDTTHFQPPDFMSDGWLDNQHPDYSHIHNNLVYETMKIRRDFYGPETIKLPSGGTMEIRPPEAGTE